MARCAIRAAFSSGAILLLARIPAPSFRRLTLRSATGKSQRDFPTKIKNCVRIRPLAERFFMKNSKAVKNCDAPKGVAFADSRLK